jgi:hypothetical protein
MAKELLTVEGRIRLQAFRQGFHAGAERSSGKRHRVDAKTHPDWLAGYRKGYAAAGLAVGVYELELAEEAELAQVSA